MTTIQYTIRGIPASVDKAFRRQASVERRSLNAVVLEALAKAAGFVQAPTRYHDLDAVAGTWVEDQGFDRVIRDIDRVDEGLWK